MKGTTDISYKLIPLWYIYNFTIKCILLVYNNFLSRHIIIISNEDGHCVLSPVYSFSKFPSRGSPTQVRNIYYSTVTDKTTELTGLTGWNIHRRLYNTKQGCIVDLHKDTYGGEWYTYTLDWLYRQTEHGDSSLPQTRHTSPCTLYVNWSYILMLVISWNSNSITDQALSCNELGWTVYDGSCVTT